MQVRKEDNSRLKGGQPQVRRTTVVGQEVTNCGL